VTAVQWLAEPPYPMAPFERITDARRWLARHLESS